MPVVAVSVVAIVVVGGCCCDNGGAVVVVVGEGGEIGRASCRERVLMSV